MENVETNALSATSPEFTISDTPAGKLSRRAFLSLARNKILTGSVVLFGASGYVNYEAGQTQEEIENLGPIPSSPHMEEQYFIEKNNLVSEQKIESTTSGALLIGAAGGISIVSIRSIWRKINKDSSSGLPQAL